MKRSKVMNANARRFACIALQAALVLGARAGFADPAAEAEAAAPAAESVPQTPEAPAPTGGATPDQKYIQEYLDAAFSAYVTEDYETALINFQRVLQIDPRDPAALKGVKLCRKKLERGVLDRMKEEENRIKLARKLMQNQKWLDAIDNLRDILSRSPQQARAADLLSEIETVMRKKVSDSVVGSGDYLFYQGILFYLNRRYGDALRVWKEAEAISYNNVKVSIYIERVQELSKENAQYEAGQDRQRARAAMEAESYDEAATLWRRVLEGSPQDAESLAQLEKAQSMSDKKNKQNLIGEYYDRGLTYFQEENFAASLVEWKKILAIDPSNEVAQEYVKRIEKKGPAAPADVAASTAAAKPPPASGKKKPAAPVEAEVSASSAPVAASVPPAAASAVPEIPAPPAAPPLSLDRGKEYLREGRYNRAVEFFDGSVRKQPENAEAREWLDRALKEQDQAANEHYKKGIVAYSIGNVEEAVQEWRTALEIYPNHLPSKRAMSKLEGAQPAP